MATVAVCDAGASVALGCGPATSGLIGCGANKVLGAGTGCNTCGLSDPGDASGAGTLCSVEPLVWPIVGAGVVVVPPAVGSS